MSLNYVYSEGYYKKKSPVKNEFDGSPICYENKAKQRMRSHNRMYQMRWDY